MTRAARYARISHSDGTPRSIAAQVALARQCAEAVGAQVVETFTDEAGNEAPVQGANASRGEEPE
ncbi:MAG TPA: recombinase family protein [Beijerinckiaceae bacterium]|nr:recombinase family protein [Beijerinckiaceae bacterium]